MKLKYIFLLPIILFSNILYTQENKSEFNLYFKILQHPFYKGFFKLQKFDGEEDFHLLVGPDKEHLCKFIVKRISAPQQTRGMNGVIFSNKSEFCTFSEILEIETFWNNIELIDINYKLNEENKIVGQIRLSTLEKTYIGKIE